MRKSSVVLARNPYWRTSILQFKGYNDSWDRVVQRSHFLSFPHRFCCPASSSIALPSSTNVDGLLAPLRGAFASTDMPLFQVIILYH